MTQWMRCLIIISLSSFLRINPQALPQPSPLQQELLELVFNWGLVWTSPSWTKLFADICSVILSTLAPYQTAQQHYAAFCNKARVRTLFSVNEETLCRFAAYLGLQSLKHRTIKAYLSGIWFVHIQQGLGDPL